MIQVNANLRNSELITGIYSSYNENTSFYKFMLFDENGSCLSERHISKSDILDLSIVVIEENEYCEDDYDGDEEPNVMGFAMSKDESA